MAPTVDIAVDHQSFKAATMAVVRDFDDDRSIEQQLVHDSSSIEDKKLIVLSSNVLFWFDDSIKHLDLNLLLEILIWAFARDG
ncbi:hypothetical protein U1Q18_024534 [Sarracenia purpurea var. burkii]